MNISLKLWEVASLYISCQSQTLWGLDVKNKLWQIGSLLQCWSVLSDVINWIGSDDSQVLVFLLDLDLWGLPLDNDVAWLDDDWISSRWLVEDDTSLDLAVWQPAFNDDVLWLGWQWGQAFDDDLARRWRELLATDGDLLDTDWHWWFRWGLTDDERLWRLWTWWLLADDEWWRWTGDNVRLLGDDDFAWCWWGWWSQVTNGKLLYILDLMSRSLRDHFWFVVLVDGVILKWDGSSPGQCLFLVHPDATVAEDFDLCGLIDLDWLVGAE